MLFKISEKSNEIGDGFIEYFESCRSEDYKLSERDRAFAKQAIEYSLMSIKPPPKTKNLKD